MTNRDRWDSFRRNKAAFAAAILMLSLIGAAILGPPLMLAYNNCGYATQDFDNRLQDPGRVHPLGTDTLGRDNLVRVLYGLRVSLVVGVVATLISVLIGAVYGAISGYFGGWVDDVMMRTLDMIYALPILILIIILFALFEKSFWLLVLALGSISWLSMARIVRGQVLTLRNEQFIDAARLLGATPVAILWRHILPNILGPVIVAATLTVPSVVLTEAFLSFLGMGVQAPLPSLGTLASDGAQVMALYPPLLLGPATVLILSLVSLSLIGDGLRDALDPQSRKL